MYRQDTETSSQKLTTLKGDDQDIKQDQAVKTQRECHASKASETNHTTHNTQYTVLSTVLEPLMNKPTRVSNRTLNAKGS